MLCYVLRCMLCCMQTNTHSPGYIDRSSVSFKTNIDRTTTKSTAVFEVAEGAVIDVERSSGLEVQSPSTMGEGIALKNCSVVGLKVSAQCCVVENRVVHSKCVKSEESLPVIVEAALSGI